MHLKAQVEGHESVWNRLKACCCPAFNHTSTSSVIIKIATEGMFPAYLSQLRHGGTCGLLVSSSIDSEGKIPWQKDIYIDTHIVYVAMSAT